MIFFDRLEAGLVLAIKVFLVVCFLALIGLVSYQVASRLGGFLPIWHATEELARGLFIWLVMIGAALGVHHQEHFSLQLASVTRGRYARAIRIAMAAAIVFVAGIFVVYGWDFMQSGLRRRSLTTGLTATWFYASLFVSGVLMAFFSIRNLVALWRDKTAAAPEPTTGSL